MNIILGILAVLFCLFVCFILGCFIVNDIQCARRYKNSPVYSGKVCTKLENVDVPQYGGSSYKHGSYHSSYMKTYRQYLVTYTTDGEEHTGNLITKDNLIIGQAVDVHCAKNEETGEWECLSSIYSDRINMLIIATIGGCVLAAFIMLAQHVGLV